MIDYATDSNSVAKTYTWGLDLSGNLEGAGGVGGLLCVTKHEEQGTKNGYYVTYDANGNISEYVDDTDSVVAHYEYSPFGKITSSSGSKSSDFRHRFSTKYLDDETNLYYYGYRYYSSELGRWLSRDPIAESGGLNLYIMLNNSPIYLIDYLGKGPLYWFHTGNWNPSSAEAAREYHQAAREGAMEGLNRLTFGLIEGIKSGASPGVSEAYGATETVKEMYKSDTFLKQQQKEELTSNKTAEERLEEFEKTNEVHIYEREDEEAKWDEVYERGGDCP